MRTASDQRPVMKVARDGTHWGAPQNCLSKHMPSLAKRSRLLDFLGIHFYPPDRGDYEYKTPAGIGPRPVLDWEACITDPAAADGFRARYLKAFLADKPRYN